ncbi:two-component system histidine kinase PnpS [Secundilactobacillus collinoides]|uniref:histidine kinase n=1 Tax=Secundilactobacillus collinoides DSM 20515 = JCM 1123 TaxID=1423733 RepID=A0A0R2BIB0_SECCO|nr:ATP-binding protein [Secundilactobacillus collinoides]KRM75420.1 Signal transduction histidine kinase [Secundilactobacillus collinoides DSM 20515 = JCM 1123]
MIKRISAAYAIFLGSDLIISWFIIGMVLREHLTWHEWGQILAINLVIALIEMVGAVRILHVRELKITAMTRKVQGMLRNEEPAHILLKKTDEYYALTMAINQLQTHQQKLLRAKAQQGEELKLLLSYLPIGVMVIDNYRKVELANPAMAELLQTPISSHRHPFVQDIQQFELVALINKVFEDKTTRRQVITLPGMPTEKRVEATVVYTSTSEDFFQILVLLYDITEISTVEQMQMDFLTNASHELKTPVTAINGFAETLLAGAKNDPATLDQFLNIIQQESQQLSELVQDILSLSRIESQSVTQHDLTSVNLADLVDDQLAVLQQLAGVKQVTLHNEVPADSQVTTDQKKMVEVLKNLLSNAIKYNQDAGQVVVTFEQSATSWQLHVKDSGIGISQEDQSRIFQRFYRADDSRTKQVVSGTGLGLAIVAELVAAMNGQISVKSQRGVGSTFTIEMPNNGSK